MNTRLFALFGAALLAGVALGPAMAAAESTAAGNTSLNVAVTQDDGVTVSVTSNGTGVSNATVDVAVLSENVSYEGAGTYTTDENGTVGLPSPNETVDVAITASADNMTAETTTTLEAADATDASFGDQVSAFVQELQNTTNATGIGDAVSTFVVANNPGNAPVHAGGPGGPNATENDTQGPPSFVQSMFGNDDADNETADNETVDRGPPAHAGGPNAADDADGNETDADDNETAADAGGGQGPPDHAGNGDDGDEDESDDDDDRGSGQGPPDQAGPGNDADE